MARFRIVIGEAGGEELLKATIDAAIETKTAKPAEFERVIVDSTEQEKAIAHPVDSRLLEVARHKVVQALVNTDVRGRSYAPAGKTPVTYTVGGTRQKLSMIATVTSRS